MESGFEVKFKDAIEFLENSNISSPNKPVIPHAKRVGEILYGKGFSNDVVIAGLLHDILEWSSTTETEIEKKFGKRVLELVKANTKDRNIQNKLGRRQDQIKRCIGVGNDALAIKIADNCDSFGYYLKVKNEHNLQRCREWSSLLIEHLTPELEKIFLKDLEKIKNF